MSMMAGAARFVPTASRPSSGYPNWSDKTETYDQSSKPIRVQKLSGTVIRPQSVSQLQACEIAGLTPLFKNPKPLARAAHMGANPHFVLARRG
jgi:hypothetical protein